MDQQQLASKVTLAAQLCQQRPNLGRLEFVGPAVGELAQNGFLAIVASLGCILALSVFALSGVWRLGLLCQPAHDVIVTLRGLFMVQMEFDTAVLAAVLTVVGYSLNDTMVVFDRVRENARRLRKGDMREIVISP